MGFKKNIRPVEILLIEDNPGDIRLTIEAFKESKIANSINIAEDGIEAIKYLKKKGKFKDKPLPDIILLDLNLPKKGGREVLAEIKEDKILKHIPVVVFTTSKAEIDILKSYELHANCYISKPLNINQFIKVVKAIEYFWFSIVRLPVHDYNAENDKKL